MKRQACRRRLRLPQTQKSSARQAHCFPAEGSIRSIAHFRPRRRNPKFHLALAGPRRIVSGIPQGECMHDFGVLSVDQVSFFFNALDVAVVCNRDSSFGRYNFPQKARELIACHTALVAADVGAMKDILRDHRQCLFIPDDPDSLAAAIRMTIGAADEIDAKVPAWSDLAAQLEAFFQTSSTTPHEPVGHQKFSF